VGRSFNRLEISQNSAGLGIPRGGVKNLNQLSNTVQQQGFATAKVHSAALGNNSSRGGNYAPASQMGAWHGGGASSTSAGHSSSGHSSAH